MNSDQPFSHALAPCKTLWFEFLLTPDLLGKHLNQKNPDPNPIELIISFLNNINTNSSSSSSSTTTNNDENVNNNGVPINSVPINSVPINSVPINSVPQPINNGQLVIVSNQDGSNSNSTENGINLNSKKYLGIRLLALKVASFLRFDLDTLESNLPITMQFTLLNELIRICDNNAGNNCSLFAYINYYRWILRSVIKLSYPSRKSYSIPVPLLQQIDPCYLPHETLDVWFKKLRELSATAVNGLEKVIKENELKELTNIIMPNFDCFSLSVEEETNEISFDWQQVSKLNTNEIMDTVKFELGKWFFFNENYAKASAYFNKINLKGRSQAFKERFQNLEEFKKSSNDMLADEKVDRVAELLADDLSAIKIGDCLDLTRFSDPHDKKEPKKLLNELQAKHRQADAEAARNLKPLAYYLSLKLPNCSGELLKLADGLDEADGSRMDTAPPKSSAASQRKGAKKGLNAQDIFQDDLEFKLIEATDPEQILNLISKIDKSPPEINKLWELPKIYVACLKSVKNLTQQHYNRCFFILAKAFELRNAKYYAESRTLFLSLLEDVQASMQPLAELITCELLLTDLEIQTDSVDQDERRIAALIENCEGILLKQVTISDILPELMQHCCIFLLEYDVPILKDYLQSSNLIIRLTASLYCLTNLPQGNVANFAKELWETVLSVFLDSRSSQSQPKRRKGPPSQKAAGLTIDLLISYVNNLKSPGHICLLASCIARIHNLIKDNQGIELSAISPIQWPNTIGAKGAENIELGRVSLVLKLLLAKALKRTPNDITFIKCRAELALVECQFHESLRNFLKILIITTDYFKAFQAFDNEPIIQKMIVCSVKLGCYTQAAVLHQMTREVNYQLVFKALGEKICYDSCDDLYDCIWDLTILEFLVNMHCKRGELDRKTKVVRMIGQLELNANNVEEIREEASNVRRGKFFRYMAKKYL